jgi:(E)-4-hydroxy-3-methylbut-2-enyl-diphosphate synthase
VYVNGTPDHRLKDADIVEHMVEIVEKKAAEIEKARAAEQEAAPPKISAAS